MQPQKKRRKIAIWVALLGITIELLAIWLLASDRISTAGAMPLIIVGMFLAFVPAFMLTRSRR